MFKTIKHWLRMADKKPGFSRVCLTIASGASLNIARRQPLHRMRNILFATGQFNNLVSDSRIFYPRSQRSGDKEWQDRRRQQRFIATPDRRVYCEVRPDAPAKKKRPAGRFYPRYDVVPDLLQTESDNAVTRFGAHRSMATRGNHHILLAIFPHKG